MNLDELVQAFLQENPKWVDLNRDTGGHALCDHASEELVEWLEQRSIEARWVWMELVEHFPNDLKPHPSYPDHAVGEPGSEHCVVLVMDHVVDLTARQYDDKLPFPFIWRP